MEDSDMDENTQRKSNISPTIATAAALSMMDSSAANVMYPLIIQEELQKQNYTKDEYLIVCGIALAGIVLGAAIVSIFTLGTTAIAVGGILGFCIGMAVGMKDVQTSRAEKATAIREHTREKELAIDSPSPTLEPTIDSPPYYKEGLGAALLERSNTTQELQR
jgi:small neutral amino acid transporter SnatA (MarC family)